MNTSCPSDSHISEKEMRHRDNLAAQGHKLANTETGLNPGSLAPESVPLRMANPSAPLPLRSPGTHSGQASEGENTAM